MKLKKKKNHYPLSPLGTLQMCPFLYDFCEIKHEGTLLKAPLGGDLSWASRGKYHNVKLWVNGIYFQSASEARRYSKLAFLEKQKVIDDLQLQPPFPIVVKGRKIKVVRFDFAYNFRGLRYWEDVKGMKTKSFKENWALVSALYPACNFCII